jgi:hypothetical protein
MQACSGELTMQCSLVPSRARRARQKPQRMRARGPHAPQALLGTLSCCADLDWPSVALLDKVDEDPDDAASAHPRPRLTLAAALPRAGYLANNRFSVRGAMPSITAAASMEPAAWYAVTMEAIAAGLVSSSAIRRLKSVSSRFGLGGISMRSVAHRAPLVARSVYAEAAI